MTYCLGILLDSGVIFASDSRTHAGVDNFASFCKMTAFDRIRRSSHRPVELRKSGRHPGRHQPAAPTLHGEGCAAEPLDRADDVRHRVADAMRDLERRDGMHLKDSNLAFNASFILGGQIKGEPP